MKRIILTVLDNNDEIWYRCFIPFILSLRKTNFEGDVGVISYQLSPQKKQKLLENNILVFDALNYFPEVLMDRHISTAHIAKTYGYDQIALYDADIWFSVLNLSIFYQIQGESALYCSYDVLKPSFITNNLPTDNKREYKEKLNLLHQRQNYLWQAGVILASQSGWENYANYILRDLACLQGFSMNYGIDATVLNLYACDSGNVKHLPEKYNCLPFWGMKLNESDNGSYFSLHNEPVEGLHITRYHRNSKEYNYIELCKRDYLSRGEDFKVENLQLNQYVQCENIFSALSQNNNNELKVEEIVCGSLFSQIDTDGLIANKGDLILNFKQDSKLVLKNYQHRFIIGFLYQKLFNKKLPVSIEVRLNNRQLKFEENVLYSISIDVNDILEIETKDLWQSQTGIRYIFQNVKFV